ncbi:hypothetical protein L9F63_003760, partial [Diploptera punctata]
VGAADVVDVVLVVGAGTLFQRSVTRNEKNGFTFPNQRCNIMFVLYLHVDLQFKYFL